MTKKINGSVILPCGLTRRVVYLLWRYSIYEIDNPPSLCTHVKGDIFILNYINIKNALQDGTLALNRNVGKKTIQQISDWLVQEAPKYNNQLNKAKMAYNYLQEAIDKFNQSEGDCTLSYQAVLLRQAQINLQISIAQSLAKIAEALEKLNSTIEVGNDQNIRDKFYGG